MKLRDRLASALPSPLDVAGVAGALSLAHGAAEIYRPAGWIVLGVELIAAVLVTARARAGQGG